MTSEMMRFFNRRQIYNYIYSRAKVAIGAHVTRKHLRLVAVDMYGNIIKRLHLDLEYSHTPDSHYAPASDFLSLGFKNEDICARALPRLMYPNLSKVCN